MRYIVALILVLFFGCEKKESKSIKEPLSIKKDYNKTTFSSKKIIANLTFINNKLVYPKKRVVLLFENNSTFSKMQEEVLHKLNIKFIKTDSDFLKKYFKIKIYPTTLILENNKTIKYENFTPYEILKAERF